MSVVVIVFLAVVVAVVAVDALARLDERGWGRKPPPDPTGVTTQKIIVDLTRRR